MHNWATELSGGAPSLEFVAPTKIYVVVNGVKVHLELGKVPVSVMGEVDTRIGGT